MSVGEAVLTYYNSSQLRATVTLDKSYSEAANVFLTNTYRSGTPVDGANHPTLSFTINDTKLNIIAAGAGFVSGHMLVTKYLVIE